MAALKRGKARAIGSARTASGKRRHPVPTDVAPNTPAADVDDTTPGLAPIFEIEAVGGDAPLEGAVDDWAGLDTVADMADEPAERHRRR